MREKTIDLICNTVKQKYEEGQAQNLTIISLCEELGMTRQNFYYYFDSIEDCVNYILIKENPFSGTVDNIEDLICNTLNYFYQNKIFVLSVMKDKSTKAILESFLISSIKYNINKFMKYHVDRVDLLSDSNKTFIVDYYAHAFVTPIMDFIENGMEKNIQQTAKKFYDFIDGDIQHSVDKVILLQKNSNL